MARPVPGRMPERMPGRVSERMPGRVSERMPGRVSEVPRPLPDGVGRHCWVLDPPGLPGRWPGVLLEWRRGRGGWQGWVSYVAVVGGRPSFVQGWLDADRLRPVPG